MRYRSDQGIRHHGDINVFPEQAFFLTKTDQVVYVFEIPGLHFLHQLNNRRILVDDLFTQKNPVKDFSFQDAFYIISTRLYIF